MKFMLIDPAGDQATQKGEDAWAYGVFGVERSSDEVGASKIFILDLEIAPRRHDEAIEAITRMYLRNGVIQTLAVEKVGQSTAEIHIANALRAQNRFVSTETGSLSILKPSGRNKADRIVSSLQWPLNNGKWFYSTDINEKYIVRLKDEMDKFPFWHDDGLDICAYLYDILKDYRFSRVRKLESLPYAKIGVV
jgi:phosphoribosylformylglycinamidine (FGAM) synthase PurS component